MPVYLLRHGQSLHNVEIHLFMSNNPQAKVGDRYKECAVNSCFALQAWEWWQVEDKFDPGIRDADLTDIGCQQARDLRQQISDLNPTLLVLSPLTRNLRTTYEACFDIINSSNPPDVVITPLAREHTYSTCDLGLSPSTLSSVWPQWEQELSVLEEHWWCHRLQSPGGDISELSSNTENFDNPVYCREPWMVLQNRASQLIALLSDYLKSGGVEKNILLVGHAVLFYAITGKWMDNCQLIELDMNNLREPCACPGYVCTC